MNMHRSWRGAVRALLTVLLAQLLAASSASAGDEALLPALLQRLRQHDAVRVQFTQYKTLRILKKPLRSDGSLSFLRGRGMVWRVTAPVAATYVLDGRGMREVVTDGTTGATRTAASMQGGAVPDLLPLFDAIFAGNEAELARHFDYRISGTPQQWRLELVPRDELLARVISRLELDGSDYIDNIVLFDTRGDQTRIELQQPQFDQPDADETSLLQ
jgi:outer membrane lipoprotein-sorting protein